jgi:hypothetical protein
MSRKLLTLAACGALAAASLAVSSPASARPASTPESLTVLTSGVVHVTTSTGKHLDLSIRATRFAKTAGGSNVHQPSTLQVSLRGDGGHELHQWSFRLAPNSFVDIAGGSGTLKTMGQIAPYGRLSLVISPLSNLTTQVCDNSNRNRIHRVALKGTLTFLTHSTGPDKWGGLAHREVEFTHGKLSAGHGPDVEEACTIIPCLAGVSWDASHGDITLLGDDVAAKGKNRVSRIVATRPVKLATPAHAVRADTVTVRAPAPTTATAGGITTLHATTAGGIVSGSAKLTSTGHVHYQQGCSVGHLAGTIWNAVYTAASPPLTAHEQIFGPLTIAVTKSATFINDHVA